MNIGIVGLGLMGGSAARAFKKDDSFGEYRVYGKAHSKETIDLALAAGAIDGELTDEIIPTLDLLIVALYPKESADYLTEKAPLISKSAMVTDFCGIKKAICDVGFALAKQYGFKYIGVHPMAGTQYSGFKHSKADMFKGAPLVIVPEDSNDIEGLGRIKSMLRPLGFGMYSVTDPDTHDAVIAYTSQLAHVVSNAYVKSPTAQVHHGFSAGSYKDLTRVAWLNEEMWTQLFLDNRQPLLNEIDSIINSLKEYRNAISDNDAVTLKRLLKDGRECKERADGK